MENVRSHLREAYRKLGVNTRAELARAVSRSPHVSVSGHLKPVRCTTYHSPRHEMSDETSRERSLPSTS